MVINLKSVLSKAIELFKSDVTLKIKSSVYSIYGDETPNTSNVTTIATVNDVSGDEEWNVEGVFVPGDKVFFFKGDQVGVEAGNIVELNSVEYEISQEPIKHIIGNNIQHIETRAKKI